MPHNYDISSYALLLVPLAGLFTWMISIRIYPIIIYVVQKKGLMDEPDQRSSHHSTTPTLGGVGMFLSFSVALMLCGIVVAMPQPDLIRLISVIASTIILLFLGIKDDLIVLAPKKKFIGQIFSAGIAIILTDVRITGFGGLLGIMEVPYLFSVLFTLFVFIVVINAFNLTDGVDGLAGSLALLASLFFGAAFLLNGEVMLSLISFTLIGAIIGFLGYNFSESRKMFMGDSGSLFLGFLLAYQGVSFLSVVSKDNADFGIPHGAILLLALLSYPMTDSLRVFFIRVRQKRSPFSPDKNHIHHRYLKLGLSHKQATLAILASNITLVGLVWLMNTWDPTVQFLMGFAIGMLLYLFPFILQ